jgi:curved DNA binding protein
MATKKVKENVVDPLFQLEDEANLNKYKMAGKIASKVLDELINVCKPGTTVYQMCTLGDKMILEEVQKVYNGVNKGISFPTCVSVNNVSGFNTPKSETGQALKDGDMVKIELGVHIDGYPALVCYTVLIGSVKQDDRRMDALKAMSDASKDILSIMKPGKTNIDVVKIMEKYAQKYNCQLPTINENIHAPGVMSYQISRYVVDGYNDDDDEFIHRLILCKQNDNYDFDMRETEFELDEVYAIDILYSTGTGKLNRVDAEPQVYKRLQDKRCTLRLKASKATLSSFGRNRFPMNQGSNSDTRWRLGLKECVNNGLVEAYQPVGEKKGIYTARTKFTVIVRDKPVLIVARSADEQLKKIDP